MIGRLKGTILEKQPPQVLLEIHNIGYEINMPITCFYKLPNTGQEAVIYTHFIGCDNNQLLFGFINKQERTLFRELVKVNGVSTKIALAILSGMSVQQFLNAIANHDVHALVKLPGIGQKIAERLLVEMKDRFKKKSPNLGTANQCYQIPEIISDDGRLSSNPEIEAISGLVRLGYQPHEAKRMVNKVITSSTYDCESLIRHALRAVM